jgi:hypothetical protein
VTHDQALRATRNRFTRRAGAAAVVAAGAFVIAVAALVGGAWLPALAAGVVVLMAVRRAYRSAMAARAIALTAAQHRAVRFALERLAREGWSLGECLEWNGAGRVAHVAIGRAGVGFVVELTTADYLDVDINSVRMKAGWLADRRGLRMGAFPVLCVVGAVGIQRIDNAVIVCSTDRLEGTLRQQNAQRIHDSVSHVGSAMLPALPRA